MTAPEHPTDALPPDASPELRVMAEAAYKAAQGLQEAFRQRHTLQVSEKTAGDFVSDADRASEATLAQHLTAAYPAYGWLGEENGARPGNGSDLRWVVDPLDGTGNFLKGIPHWAISIALCQGEDPMAGLIYNVEKKEFFSAEHGKGAFLNGTPIKVSEEVSLKNALFATGMPAGGRVTYLKDALADLGRLMPQCAGIRRNGAAALDFAYVAAGRFDGYWERNLGPWDIAAGVVLVREAGGTVDRLWPDSSIFESGSFLASNGHLAKDLRSAIV